MPHAQRLAEGAACWHGADACVHGTGRCWGMPRGSAAAVMARVCFSYAIQAVPHTFASMVRLVLSDTEIRARPLLAPAPPAIHRRMRIGARGREGEGKAAKVASEVHVRIMWGVGEGCWPV